MHPIPTWATSSEPRRASLGSLLLLICSVTACHHKVLHLPVHLASSSILNSLSGSFPSLLHSFPDTLILCSLPYQPHWSIPATQAVHPANCHCTSPRIGSAARACFKTNYNPFGYTTPLSSPNSLPFTWLFFHAIGPSCSLICTPHRPLSSSEYLWPRTRRFPHITDPSWTLQH